MDAKEFLTRNVLLNEEINMDFLHLQRLKRLLEQLGGSAVLQERVQGGQLPNAPTTKLVEQIADLEREIDTQLAENNETQKKIKKAIAYCKDYDEIRILKKRYLEQKEWETISLEIGCSESKIYTLHKSALTKIEDYLKTQEDLE